MVSVDVACAYALSLGSEGLNIRPSRVVLRLVVFTRLLVWVFWIDTTRRYYSFKGPSESSPYVLMIVWALVRWVSESCMNRNWRLTVLRSLRYRLWDSSCSCSLTHFFYESCHRNDVVDQQEWVRHLWHWYFVLWRTHFKIVEYLHMVLHHITWNDLTNNSSVFLNLHSSSEFILGK